eukprot:3437319-Pleurochrysis_carterae.AAC.2
MRINVRSVELLYFLADEAGAYWMAAKSSREKTILSIKAVFWGPKLHEPGPLPNLCHIADVCVVAHEAMPRAGRWADLMQLPSLDTGSAPPWLRARCARYPAHSARRKGNMALREW